MKHAVLNKSIVYVILFLFVGAGVIPCLYGETIPSSSFLYDASRQIGEVGQKKLLDDFASASLFFTKNQGQLPAEVLFQVHVCGATVYLCKNKIVTVFSGGSGSVGSLDLNYKSTPVLNQRLVHEPLQSEMISVVAEFVGANPDVVITGKHRLLHCSNYFIGNDPLKWYTDVPNYQGVIYQDMYPGVDLTYYGDKGGVLKYDFIVHPDADVSSIQVRYSGVDGLSITRKGSLRVETRFGMISEKIPFVYQKVDGVTHEIQGRYVIRKPGVFGFTVKGYNPVLPLVIDPVLAYSTYIGGSAKEQSWGIAVDGSGFAYVTGRTYSVDFPVVNPYDGTYNGDCDVFVSKFSPSGNALVYSTYLGGSDDESTWYGDDGGIAVDGSGFAYVTGTTYSVDFPVVNPYDDTRNGDCDVFVSKLSPSGNALVYSTYLGGSDYEIGYGITVDGSGSAYVTGTTYSVDFPVVDPYDGTYNGDGDVFVSKLSLSGSALVYSTYLGESDYEVGWGIAVDGFGSAYVTGRTNSFEFPVENPYDDTYNGGSDVFVSKLSPSGNALIYSTYLGGSDDESFWAGHGDIAVDGSGSAYVTGTTYSVNFPVENPYDRWLDGWDDVFVSKFSPTGDTLVYSTYLGGISQEFGFGIAVDGSGSAYVTGTTYSVDFPVENPCDDSFTGWCDVFVSKLSPTGESLAYSTYLGGSGYEIGYGIAVDDSGNAFVTGTTKSLDFPLENPYDDTYNDNYDGFVSKFVQEGGNKPPAIPDINGPSNGITGSSYDFTFNAADPDGNFVKYIIKWGDGSIDTTAFNPSGTDVTISHTWSNSGIFTLKAKAEDSNGLAGLEATFSVTMPRIKIVNNMLFQKYIQDYANLF